MKSGVNKTLSADDTADVIGFATVKPVSMTCRRYNILLRERIHLNVSPEPSQWALSQSMRYTHSIAAGAILIAFLPVMALVALAIKFDSKGPIFFKQKRTGYMGRRFKVYKFRTMVADAEALKSTVIHLNKHGENSCDFKADNDPRITRIGKFLRKTSLDELPNLINVIQGDMRIVGPRPTSFCASTYDEDHHMRRLSVYPGITGLWQISGRSNICFNERVELDQLYASQASPLLDLKIIIKTPLKVLKAEGAS